MKKLSVFLLSAVIVMSIFSMNAFALNIAEEGICGDPEVNGGKNVTWEIDSDTSTLTVRGQGDMASYFNSDAPWKCVGNQVKNVVIEEGVTEIGEECFLGMSTVENVKIADSVTWLGRSAFENCSALKNISFGKGPCGNTMMAFQSCSALESVTIPSSFRQIGLQMFSGCYALKDVYLEFDPEYNEIVTGQDWLHCGYNMGTTPVIHLVAKEVDGYKFKEWRVSGDESVAADPTNANTTVGYTEYNQSINAVYEKVVTTTTTTNTSEQIKSTTTTANISDQIKLTTTAANISDQIKSTTKTVVDDKSPNTGININITLIFALIILAGTSAVIAGTLFTAEKRR